jgi:alpha-galactosidase
MSDDCRLAHGIMVMFSASGVPMRSFRCLVPALTGFMLAGSGMVMPALAVDAPAQPAAPTLTPAPAATPRINGARVFGVRPSSPILYTVAATGERPMTFAAAGIPEGATFDPATGRLGGSVAKAGTYPITIVATNAKGRSERVLRLVVGDAICLTPPMGWNSWNCWGGAVSQDKVLASARMMVAKGLRDHGWTYINIDDGWQGVRGGAFNAIQPNSKFPDMKGLGDAIHDLGLKFGIYSTPWRGTYEGHIGSSGDREDGIYDWVVSGDHNEFIRVGGKDGREQQDRRKQNYQTGRVPFVRQDAQQWAAWGVDYLKYDWYPNDVPNTEAMTVALRATGRDIVYSLSNSAPKLFAEDWARLANAWRTTGDITDTWKSISGIGFDNQEAWTGFGGPGHWNDPDMLVVGQVGWGPSLHPTRLTPDEQYTHLSLWALLAAPLLIGCDLEQLDAFTIGLLTNDEVLDVDQDPLGKQGRRIAKKGDLEIYAKPLEGGDVAVGLFNRSGKSADASITWNELGISGTYRIRDLWRQQDVGESDKNYTAQVAVHGVRFVRLTRIP